VLEAYTYWKTVDQKKLLCNFGIKDAKLRKAVLLFYKSAASNDFFNLEYEMIDALAKTDMLDVSIFIIIDEKE